MQKTNVKYGRIFNLDCRVNLLMFSIERICRNFGLFRGYQVYVS